jgi:hypothetical protein
MMHSFNCSIYQALLGVHDPGNNLVTLGMPVFDLLKKLICTFDKMDECLGHFLLHADNPIFRYSVF